MLLKFLKRQLLVAVDHSQLPKIKSETVDSIDWQLPPTLYRVVPLSATSTMKMRATNQECHGRELNSVLGWTRYERHTQLKIKQRPLEMEQWIISMEQYLLVLLLMFLSYAA